MSLNFEEEDSIQAGYSVNVNLVFQHEGCAATG